MPRRSRLDSVGALHHVMARGIERRDIFITDGDHRRFVDRLGKVIGDTMATLYAWSLLPNHFHLLVRTGRISISGVMRRLLTGYALYFNRVHERVGHLFQNRYKSVLVDEETYLLELVRYIHLNPVRAGLVRGVDELDTYPWAGHSVLMGRQEASWQEIEDILGRFGEGVGVARMRYRRFVEDGVDQGRRPELVGGGLKRSLKGMGFTSLLLRGREKWAHDERILGSNNFVERVLREYEKEAEERDEVRKSWGEKGFDGVVSWVARQMGLEEAEILGGGRRKVLVEARDIISFIAMRYLGMLASEVGRRLRISKQSVLRGAGKGEKLFAERAWSVEEMIKN